MIKIQNNNNYEPRPYDEKTELVSNEYEVLEDGNIKLTQTVRTESYFSLMEFSKIKSNNERAKENLKKQLSDEYREKISENIEKIDQQNLEIVPYLQESEKKSALAHEKRMQEMRAAKIKNDLQNKDSKDINIGKLYEELSQENKERLMKEVNKEDKTRLQRSILEYKLFLEKADRVKK